MALENESAPGGDQIRVTTRRSVALGEPSLLGKGAKGKFQFGKRKDALQGGSPGKLSKGSASTVSEGLSKLRGKGALG